MINLLFAFLTIIIVYLAWQKFKSNAPPKLLENLQKLFLVVGIVIGLFAALRFGAQYLITGIILFSIITAKYERFVYYTKIIARIFGFRTNAKEQKTSTDGAKINMTLDEARVILGVSENASKQEIKQAYHRLMKQYHPDAGGTDYFAAKLNQAKDLLLKQKK